MTFNKYQFIVKESEDIQDAVKPNEIVKELKNIRLSIDRFLERFATSLRIDSKDVQDSNDMSIISSAPNPPSNGHHNPISNLNLESHREFDPLTKAAIPEANR